MFLQVRGATIPVGTAIATFTSGTYKGHAAIYIGQNTEGIQVWDQVRSRMKFTEDFSHAVTMFLVERPPSFETNDLLDRKQTVEQRRQLLRHQLNIAHLSLHFICSVKWMLEKRNKNHSSFVTLRTCTSDLYKKSNQTNTRLK